MQALFYMDNAGSRSEETLSLFWRNCLEGLPGEELSPEELGHLETALPFFLMLVQGVVEKGAEIDAMIERYSSNWKMSRMSCVDRNIMRIAVFEMLHCDDIPAKVSINEAIDIGKKFGTVESGAFINGILDTIRLRQEEA